MRTPTLTVSLPAIVANWQLLRERFTGDECAAVVKADGYGLGAVPVATALAAAGCHTFFVAPLAEAIELRAALPDVRILVLQGVLPGEEFAFAAHRLIPVLNSREQIERWKPVAAEHVHAVSALHLDTAMGRMGLQEHEFEVLLKEHPKALEACRVGLIMSHLACASEPAHLSNDAQLAQFSRMVAHAPGIPASLCNSGGIFLSPAHHFHLARPGCSLYGIAPQDDASNESVRSASARAASASEARGSGSGGGTPPARQRHPINPMRHVATWQAPILMTRVLEREQAVGYGATITAPKGTRIATVATGYADGYLRCLSNTSVAYVGEHRVPLLGRVTMDMLCFDVTQVPEALLGEGMPITLLGDRDGIRVDDIAAAAGTIGYEILTRIGARVERRYEQE